MTTPILTIGCHQTPKVLLLGNGINRAYQFASWGELLRELGTKSLTEEEELALEKVPYPLRSVILTEDCIDVKMKESSIRLSQLNADPEEKALLYQYAELPIDTILTTNYTYELEQALNPAFHCEPGRRCKYRKVASDYAPKNAIPHLHTYFDVEAKKFPIWHIHGEAAKADTMVIGHYFYGNLLSQVQQYISKLLMRYKISLAKGSDIPVNSWVDYFMLGDVYIVGLGMDLSELDLWWLVNCKKKHFPDRKIVLFKPDIKPQERLIADAYHMIVDETEVSEGNYKVYYHTLCEKLRNVL